MLHFCHFTGSLTCRTNAPPSPLPKPYAASDLSFKFIKFTSCPSFTATTTKTSSIVCTRRYGMGEEEMKDSESVVLQRPDSFGRFGKFGGKYVPEILMYALFELESAFKSLAGDQDFQKELDGILRDYVGRESPLYFAERLTEHYKHPNGEGPDIYLKREDLNHTGTHQINNAVAQALLAKRMGKHRVIAETGAGQHGVATATVCARFGLQCIVYMGAKDMERQSLNVFRMRLLGAEVRAVHSGTATLKDATSEAIRDWITNVESTHYILGSVAGPHPYPLMVREFHAVIGKEMSKQALEKWGGMPDVLVACVGGGSNAMGLFHEFVDDKGEVGVSHGAMRLQDEDRQINAPDSISAGLDNPGVGPEHSFLKDIGRTDSGTDEEASEDVEKRVVESGKASKRRLYYNCGKGSLPRCHPPLARNTETNVNLAARVQSIEDTQQCQKMMIVFVFVILVLQLLVVMMMLQR